jgi:hypothetical protein
VSLFVNIVDVGATLEQKLHNIAFTSLDSIIQGSLTVIIYEVDISTYLVQIHQCIKMTLSGCIKGWRLSICVDVIHIALMSNQELNHFDLAIPGSII